MSRALTKLLIFIALAYLITLPYDTLLLRYAYSTVTQAIPILLVLRNFIPLVATVTTVVMLGKGFRSVLRDYGVRGCRIRYLLLSGFIPFIVYGLGTAYALLVGFDVVNPLIPLYRDYGRELPEGGEGFTLALSLLSTFFVGSTLIAFIMFGQEVGWRGLMLVELAGITKSSLLVSSVTGTVWGLWHAPLIILYGHYFPSHRDLIGVSTMVLTSIFLSDVLMRVRLRFSSVLASSAVLGVLSGLHNLMVYTVMVGDEIYSMPYGLLGMASVATVSTLLRVLSYRYTP